MRSQSYNSLLVKILQQFAKLQQTADDKGNKKKIVENCQKNYQI